VLTTRRDGDPLGALRDGGGLETLELMPLSTEESLELAHAYLMARPEVARRCVERAQGNPLFLTQLLQSGADEGAIPGTIRHVLLARLDRLPPKERARCRRRPSPASAFPRRCFPICAVARSRSTRRACAGSCTPTQTSSCSRTR
jgi:hypothetical protein